MCHPTSAFLLPLRLPPTCLGAPNLESTCPAVRSGFRHPAAALDTGWVGWRGSPLGWAGPLRPLWNTRGDEGAEVHPGESSGMLRGAPGENATRLGHVVTPGSCLESPRCAGTCQHLHAGPAIPFRGHLTTGTRDVEPRGAQALCPAAARAALTQRQPSRAGTRRTPCRWLRPRVSRRGGRDTGLPPDALWRWSGRPPRGSLPPLSFAKSLKAPAPFVTPGASNHSVSISLTLFIQLKTHLKTLQPGVCSGLYPH